jgi:hypothetical protein
MTSKNIDHLAHPYWKGAAAFGLIVGIAMLAIWVWFLTTGAYPEPDAPRLSAWLHLIAELATAAILIVASIALITQKYWARKAYFVGIGALFIAVINAVAYYGDRGYIVLVIFFIAIAVAGVFFAMRVEE